METSASEDHQTSEPQRFLVGLGRGAGGALLFALPMQMTMEMWELGFSMDRWRLALLLVIALPLLIGISHRVGFEKTTCWQDDVRDALIAYGIGLLTSALILALFKLLTGDMSAQEITGKIAVQAIPAGIGAMLGRSQFGHSEEDEESDSDDKPNYASELFMMGVGALFLNLNMAPTEEMILISYKMTGWHVVATILLSIALMHGFVYAVSFKGGHEISDDTPKWHALVRYTFPGYVVALLVSLFSLWVFGRLDDGSIMPTITAMIVLGFPGAIGAAAARLIL